MVAFQKILLVVAVCCSASAEAPPVLPGTAPLTVEGDRSLQMRAGIKRYLARANAEGVPKLDAIRRELFCERIGVVDPRQSPAGLEYLSGPDSPAMLAETERYQVFSVRWSVFEGVYGEGLLLAPKEAPQACIVAIPDADQTPEMLVGLAGGIPPTQQYARLLADAGCQVLVPTLIDRQCTWAGNPDVAMTNQTHREWVWRQAVELGRHLIGYEVQKVQAAADWLISRSGNANDLPLGVVGYGEGGLIAFHTAAVDQRIDVALVSGYFDSRRELWTEPLYRSVFGLVSEFGDAGVASLIAPRGLIIEHSLGPQITGPPPTEAGRKDTAAPGELRPPDFESVRLEFARAQAWIKKANAASQSPQLIHGPDGATVGPGSPPALEALLSQLEIDHGGIDSPSKLLVDPRASFDPHPRQRRQVVQLVQHSQRLLRGAERMRADLWNQANNQSADTWHAATDDDRDRLWRGTFGQLPEPTIPVNARSRKILDRPTWTGYEVMLDVWPDVFAWGYLLIPKDLEPGERRPVVVCQHGLEGLPESVVTEETSDRAFRAYRAYAVQLVEQGFVTFAPHNPYRGGTEFRQIQRQANAVGLTLYSFILGQHQRILEWLGELPFVDADRIGFYGLSYGGVSALRIPSLLDGYALSICSAAFNDWPRKIMSLDFRAAYMFTHEYDHYTFGLGNSFSNAELAALIAPRPFMVERGHRDGVAPDEWVAHEYAKVRRLYAQLGIPERTEIEFFDGGHVIHGQGTFDFLRRQLNWPPPDIASP